MKHQIRPSKEKQRKEKIDRTSLKRECHSFSQVIVGNPVGLKAHNIGFSPRNDDDVDELRRMSAGALEVRTDAAAPDGRRVTEDDLRAFTEVGEEVDFDRAFICMYPTMIRITPATTPIGTPIATPRLTCEGEDTGGKLAITGEPMAELEKLAGDTP
jgi:hypothetical protein